MQCSGGVCFPTKNAAVLNVSDLQSMLASGNVTIETTGAGGVEANTIEITAALTWSNASALTLTAKKSIFVDAPVAVAGAGGVALNNSGTIESLAFYGNGHITFANLSSSLAINGSPYGLVGSVAQLANAVAGNQNGNYALANSYDASGDGTYSQAPVQSNLGATFEGLGNAISNLTINDPAVEDPLDGLFRSASGAIRDFGLANASVTNAPPEGGAGAGTLVGDGAATIWRCWATGSVSGGFNGATGGLVASWGGPIIQSWTDVAVTTNGSAAGGISGSGSGGMIIEQSFAMGSVTSVSDNVALGGLVGGGYGQISQSYSTAAITMNYATNSSSPLGGLVGHQQYPGGTTMLTQSYATGAITAPASSCTNKNCIGGWIGYEDTNGNYKSAHNYWDLNTSNVPNMGQGVGNVANAQGVKGLHTKRFVSQLPQGFSNKVWAEDPAINNGYPYLIANPPPN
jgi:hypothetical protein